MSKKKYQIFIKRILDICIALGSLIALFPVIVIVAVLVKTKLGSPIIFTQERVGKDNRIFKIIKFRTMKECIDKEGNILPDEERLTSFGKKLRSSSLDELPELINILKGDMSLVGPRPLLVDYLPLYSKEQIRRHEVLPGLTGWAQVNGRNNLIWNEKFELDVYYVENWSLTLDLKIFFLTFYKVFKREGINQDGQVTMEYFNGEN
ncbi:sugar transferase [Clostridium perfringens]|uniref:sugar transferase n=1 Tax=Clostridium perfringens TaxID=1502 RepID=UPI000F51EAE1|nr:sugar transferase [Clostridium perfringens]EHK2389215.1 sugar transferase [Clostridium perfringens]EHK2389780.1 sugar transferase [Clostridium perfringens]ELC8437729.1 sugar transferase [Clostridium perfringens]ELC8438040.1 sugar transferase [Clostridium perfringens]MDG6890116.1 Undecaprenyl phosphate NN'-diacetylbacillosamine 1-phosphate transferase [Clostridium perfringens]